MSSHDDSHSGVSRPNPEGAQDGVTLTRRNFLRGLGGAAGVMAAGVIPAALTAAPRAVAAGDEGGEHGDDPLAHFKGDQALNYPGRPVSYAEPAGPEQWAMVLDLQACIGCRRCVYACVKENNIGRTSGFTYIKILEMEKGFVELESSKLDYVDAGDPKRFYMPVQCMHCGNPSCVQGCPVKATWKEPDGIVVVDYDKCICCKNCLVTCPYEARHVNWVAPQVPENEVNPKVPLEEKAGVVEKCTFCIHRTRQGMTTKCTEACPVGARKFGDLNDPESDVSILLATRRAFRLKEELGNSPRIWYVG